MDIGPLSPFSQLTGLTSPVTFSPRIDVCVRSQTEANDQSRVGKLSEQDGSAVDKQILD